MLPNFIGIGVPKAGTTWLFKCLSEHPEIYFAEVKETFFFHHAYFDSNKLIEYEAHFEDGQTYKAIGEFSTNYFDSPGTPSFIKRTIPDVKLLLVLRNPIEQVQSHYWHLLRQNFHCYDTSNPSLELAIKKYEKRLIQPALYYQNLMEWLQYFPISQIHVIFYDDIKACPEEVVRKLYGFLNVDSDFKPLSLLKKDSDVRAGVSPKNVFLAKLYAKTYSFLVKGFYLQFVRFLGNQKAAKIKDKMRIRQLLQNIFFKKGYPEIHAKTKNDLSRHFTSDIENLEKFLKRDLSHWK